MDNDYEKNYFDLDALILRYFNVLHGISAM